MIADFILQFLGRTPEAYPEKIDKWAAISADAIDYMIPFLITLIFFSPFIFLLIRHKRFTGRNVIISLLVGGMLAYGAWLVNDWSYGYGVGVIHNEIYGDPWF